MARGTIVTRTTKEGVKRYYAALWTEKPGGGRKQVWKTFERKKDAESFLDDNSKAVREGDFVEPSKILFEAFAKEWLPGFTRPALWLMTGKRRRAAANAGVRFVYLFMRPDGEQLAELAGWIDAGKLKPLIHKTYPFADVAEAFAELERGRARGKIVVTI